MWRMRPGPGRPVTVRRSTPRSGGLRLVMPPSGRMTGPPDLQARRPIDAAIHHRTAFEVHADSAPRRYSAVVARRVALPHQRQHMALIPHSGSASCHLARGSNHRACSPHAGASPPCGAAIAVAGDPLRPQRTPRARCSPAAGALAMPRLRSLSRTPRDFVRRRQGGTRS